MTVRNGLLFLSPVLVGLMSTVAMAQSNYRCSYFTGMTERVFNVDGEGEITDIGYQWVQKIDDVQVTLTIEPDYDKTVNLKLIQEVDGYQLMSEAEAEYGSPVAVRAVTLTPQKENAPAGVKVSRAIACKPVK